MAIGDVTLTCVDCAAAYVFTVSERQFYIDKQFVDPDGRVMLPIRCPSCRVLRKQQKQTERAGTRA